ncbi:MAG: response regulator, partial [Mucilaginibacter polytrichastri]|nr:response regulator [Mucilaginibacter polytrichastri]
DVQSELEKGSVFTIKLDYAVAAMQEATIFELPHVSLRNYHILVVEDNPVNQMVVKMILKKWDNVTASYANDGAEAVEILRQKQVDLVLLDLQMPVMDGYETLTAIRKGEAGLQHSSVPVIVLTADVMETTKERVFALGANEFMTKPVDKNLLYEKSMALLSTEMKQQEVYV